MPVLCRQGLSESLVGGHAAESPRRNVVLLAQLHSLGDAFDGRLHGGGTHRRGSGRNLGFADLIGGAFAEVCQLADGAEVTGDGSLAHPGQLQIIGHAGIEFTAEEPGSTDGVGHNCVS